MDDISNLDTFEDESTITLIDEDDNEHVFEVLEYLELEGGKYVVLLPLNQEDDEEEAVLMKFTVDDDGEEVLVDIEDDDEWDKVATAYEQVDLDD